MSDKLGSWLAYIRRTYSRINRNIVERAVLAGIINEENKEFYLSAIHEENDSDLSELESRLNTKETKKQSCLLQQQNDNFNPLLKSNCTENNDDSIKEMHALLNKNLIDDCHLLLSEDSIENNSILDFKYSKNKVDIQETDSDMSSNNQIKRDSKPNRNLEKTRNSAKVMKKPRKNQIIDFDVPIYIDVSKKSLVKPNVTDSISSTQCDVSSTCCCKKDNPRTSGSKQSQNIRKMTLPRMSLSLMKTENNSPPSSVNNLVSCKKNSKSHHTNGEVSVDGFQEADKSTKHKSVHTYSLQKESSDLYKIDPAMISKDLEAESNGHQCHILNELKASSRQRLGAPTVIRTQEHKYRIKLKKPLISERCRQSFDTKKVSKVPILERAEKCKYCKCDNVSKTLRYNPDDINLEETVSEDKASLTDSPSKRNLQDTDCDRYLNVNIICQFYPDSDGKRVVNSKNDTNINAALKVQTENLENEDAVNTSTEPSKTRQSKKIHRLSKIFTNMKMNKKQKHPESDTAGN